MRTGLIALVVCAATAVARASDPVETLTLFAGELSRPAPPLAQALRDQGEVEALAGKVALPTTVLEALRATDFSRSVVVVVTGDPGVKVERATRDVGSRSIEVVATRSAPGEAVTAAHVVRLGDSHGLTQGVGRDGPADRPLGASGAGDPWAGWTIELVLGQRWERQTLAGTITFGAGETVLRTSEGEQLGIAFDPRVAAVVQRKADPGASLAVEVDGEVDRTVWMVKNVRRVGFTGTPFSAVRAEARGVTEQGALVLADCSRLTLLGWEPPAGGRPVRLVGYLLERDGAPDGRFLVLEATPLDHHPGRQRMLVIDGHAVGEPEPQGRGPIDRPLGED